MAGKEFPLAIVLSTVDKSTAGLDKVTSKLDRVGKKVGAVGKKLTLGVTTPIIGIGVAAAKAMSEFETGMGNVATLVDTSVENMDEMGKKVQEIGRRTPVSFDKLTGALFDIRSASIPAANAMNVLERSAQLGVAGLGTTEQAARLAAGAINAWNLEGEEADKVFNTIFQTTKNGITTIAGLEQGFGSVAGKMAGAGIKVDDYLASVAALTTTTLPAAQAHTQMRAAVDGLEKSGKKTRKVFRKLGVKDFKELVKTSGGVTQAFRLVSDAVGTESGALKDLIGSSEGAAAVTALIGAQGDKQLATLSDMRKETDGLADVQIAYNKQNKTSASQWQKTKNSLTSAAISIGTVLAPALEKAAAKVQDLADWFNKLSPSTKETITKIAGLVATVGPALMLFGKVASGISSVSKAMKVMNRVTKANVVVAALSGIAWAANEIYENWEDFEQFFKLVWGGVKGIFQDAWEFISGIVDKVVGAVDTVIGAGRGVMDFVTGTDRMNLGAVAEGVLAQKRGIESSVVTGRNASDGATNALISRRPVASGYEPGAEAGTAKTHVTIELTGNTAGARVQSVKGSDAVDVKTGYQGF